MSAKNRARSVLHLPQGTEDKTAKPRPMLAAAPQMFPNPAPDRTPLQSLGLTPPCADTQPRRFARVPTLD